MSLHQQTKLRSKTKLPSDTTPDQSAPKKHKLFGCRSWLVRWLIKIGLVVLVILLIIIAGTYWSAPRYYNILIIGSDQRTTERARSDVMIVVAIPKSSKDSLSFVTLPRDTKVDDPDRGIEKLTHYYAFWDDNTTKLGNRDLTVAQIEKLLDIKINGTIEITFDSFNEIVDAVGGVDTDQGHLDGAQAQELVHNRYVQPEGDFGRAAEQRSILKDIAGKLYNPFNIQKVYNYFQTSDRARLNLSSGSLTSFGLAYLIGHQGNPKIGDIHEVVLPGIGQRIYTPDFGKSLYYWVLDDAGTKDDVNKYLR